ncbi:MAG TPA: DUF5939 domain-containing protein [Spirochaetia bacterium]|nr:DUF5939 domain-containing protein [Spirochaetia bacterium]
MAVNEASLEQRLELLEKARAWSPRVVSKLEAHIRASDDEGLLRINPFQFASQKNIAEHEAVDLLLYSASVGLFTMDWSLVCPTCSEVVESFKALRNIHASFSCNLCRTNIETTLDDLIHVTFTVSPSIRDIIFHRPAELSARDYFFKYRFEPGAHYPDGLTFKEYLDSNGRIFETIPAGGTWSSRISVDKGWLVVSDLENDTGWFLEVQEGSRGPANGPVRLEMKRNAKISAGPVIHAGELDLQIVNETQTASRVFGFLEPPEPVPALLFGRVLTGKEVLGSQTFRDLFRSEVISSTEGLTVRDITILFTDLKGSTALYDRIGDLKAFALVRQHFDTLGRVILAHDGAVVKTIGDAIMASFLTPEKAVAAARGLLEGIEGFNRNIGTRDFILKIGIHRGASIAVTLNDRLDYFGQMVNIAARVQGLAEADEICITEEVHNAGGVGPLLEDFAVRQEVSMLKGINERMAVYRLKQKKKVAS